MNTRLKQFLAAENITQAQFADKINVVRASVSHILSGRNKPSFDFIKAMMLQYPNINMEWLMFGKGKMYKDSSPIESTELFPAEIPIADSAEPPAALLTEKEFVPMPGNTENERFSTEFNTLNKSVQNIVQQRKVAKILVLFDDGTYQEL